MKTLLLIFLSVFSLNLLAMDEMKIEMSFDEKVLTITKTYVGEPVSKGRYLVIHQKCKGVDKKIYEDNYCDFANFKYNNEKVTFDLKFYNPDTGECTHPKQKSVTVETKKCDVK